MKFKPKAIIFDMDGVILDSEPIHARITQKMFNKLKITVGKQEYQSFIGSNLPELWGYLKHKHKLSASLEQLIQTNNQLLYEEFSKMKNLEPKPGLLFFLEKSSELPLAVASSTHSNLVNLILQKLGIIEYFNSILGGENVARPKPNPEIFLKSATVLHTTPENILVIEDSANGVNAAKAAGMHCAALQTDASSQQNINKADLVIKSFWQLQKEIILV
jgi:HAD superfamily hydrolase (TIGR01509 family)